MEDATGRLVGVVSLTDIAAAASGEGHRLVRDGSAFFLNDWEERPDEGGCRGALARRGGAAGRRHHEPRIYSVHEDATVREVASMMFKGHIHRLLVTCEDRAVG